jgi:hypothetical protein
MFVGKNWFLNSKTNYIMRLLFKLLVPISLVVLTLFDFSCKKQFNKEKKISFKELYDLYSNASARLNKLKVEKMSYPSEKKLALRIENDTMKSILFTEEEALAIIQPLMDPTVTYLQQNYEMNIYEYLAPGDPNIAIVGSAALRLDALERENRYADTSVIHIFELGGAGLFSGRMNTIMREGEEDWYDCALRSLGIEAAVKMFDSGFSSAAKVTIKKKALRKMVVKIAARTLGIAGAAVAVYEFGDCMDRW